MILLTRFLYRYALSTGLLVVLTVSAIHAQKTNEGFRAVPKSATDNLSQTLSIQYQISMRSATASSGWMGWTSSGMAGVSDQGFSLEALQAKIEGTEQGGIWYTVYTSENQWLPWQRNGETAGAEAQQGQPKTVQALAMRLYNCPTWSVEYRVFVPNKGWLDWVRDGQAAGMIGLGGTIEALEVRLKSNAPATASLTGAEPPLLPTNARSQLAQLPKVTKPIITGAAPEQPQQQPPESVTNVTIPQQSAPAQQQTTAPAQQQRQQQPSSGQSFGQTVQQVGQAAGALGQTAQQGQPQGQWNQGQPQGQWNQGQPQGQWNQGQPQGQWNQGQPQGQSPQNPQFSTNTPNSTAVFLPMASRSIAIMAHNGRYLSGGRDARGNVLFTASRNTITEMETFQLDFLNGHKVALKAGNGRYLGIGQGWGNALTVAALSEVITATEVFEVVSAGADRVAFRASNGMHLGVDEAGAFRLYLKDGIPSWWETFIVMQPNGTPLLGGQQLPSAQRPNTPMTIYDRSGNAIEQNGGAERVLATVAGATSSSSTAAPAAAPTTGSSSAPSASAAAMNSMLSTIEREVIAELNFVRSRPNDYATFLEGYRRFYKGKTYQPPGKAAITTKEGVRALDNAITALRTIRGTLPSLEFSVGLSRAARDHVEDTGRRGLMGHVGSDRSNPNERAARYGSGIVGENCSYGPDIAREIVMQLLIDDGTRDRAHQKNILNPAYKLVGVAFGGHRTMRWMCTQVFAADFKEKQ
jgi:uncharacterized protein YkwD